MKNKNIISCKLDDEALELFYSWVQKLKLSPSAILRGAIKKEMRLWEEECERDLVFSLIASEKENVLKCFDNKYIQNVIGLNEAKN